MLIDHLSNSEKTIGTDMIIHGVERIANVYNMCFGNGNVVYYSRRIEVNEFIINASNSSVYDAGDATDLEGLYLAAFAAVERKIADANITHGIKRKPVYENIFSVVFIIPTMVNVGMSEENAEKKGIKYNSNFQETSDCFTSYGVGKKYYCYKIVIVEDNTKIHGAHLLSPSSEDVTNFSTFTINCGIPHREMKNMVYISDRFIRYSLYV